MKITIETTNVFYTGWLAHLFQLPVERVRPAGELEAVAFDEGYRTAEETGPIPASLTPEELKGGGLMKLRAIGVLYVAFLVEKELGRNIRVNLDAP